MTLLSNTAGGQICEFSHSTGRVVGYYTLPFTLRRIVVFPQRGACSGQRFALLSPRPQKSWKSHYETRERVACSTSFRATIILSQ